jgi:hypothetical protein
MASITELYEFTVDGTIYRFCPKISNVNFGGNIFVSTILSRGAIQLTDNFLKNTLQIKFSRTHSFARLLLVATPETPVRLVIYRNESVYWQGQVIGANGQGLFIELDCVTTFSKTLRPAITPRIQISCRHQLYSEGCGLNKTTFGFTTSIATIISTTSFTVASVSGVPNSYYLNGEILWNNQRRNITKQIGTTFSITYPFTGTLTGAVTIYPGCDKSEGTCRSKFSNVLNFGGFARLPVRSQHDQKGLL